MGRILVAVTPLAGHVNPMLLAAESLCTRGHDVLFHTAEAFREKVEAVNLRFLPLLGNANYDYRQMSEVVPELRTATPGTDQANVYVKHLFGDRIPDQDLGLRQIISEQSIDLVLIDVAFCGIFPLLLRDESRPPVLSCGVITPIWHDPAFLFSRGRTLPQKGAGAIWRIAGNSMRTVHQGPDISIGCSRSLGLQFQVVTMPNALYRLPDLFLQFGTEAFEYPMEDMPANLCFTGPILPTKSDNAMSTPAWFRKLDGSKPVVFVTQGTLANVDFNQLVNPTLVGLAEEDVHLVVTAGGSKADTIVAPENVIVETSIPYDLVLPKTSVFVTNGGYNGVQQALSYGVPVVSAGISEDKSQVCERVNWSRVGIGLTTSTPSRERIRNSVLQILDDSSYRERAQTIAASIGKADDLNTIAEIVEVAIANGAVQ
jgi:UDP:flavonoid glycosyltransferase YjiC (YdhE family)